MPVDTPSSNEDAVLELQHLFRMHYKAYVRPTIEPKKEQEE